MLSYKLKGYKPTRIGFGEGLAALGEKYDNVLALGADITASVGINIFAEKFPNRFFEFGIAEQNIVGVSAGLAAEGFVPFFSTYGVFAAHRDYDQVRISLCYNNLHAVIGGAHAGISVGPDGATHQALEDIAAMRVLPNITVLSPADATQTSQAVFAAYEQVNCPVYLRYARAAMPDFMPEDLPFEVGKAQILREGNDVTIFATGHLVWESLSDAEKLKKEKGISTEVINIHTIKPIDREAIISSAKKTGYVITAEEHQVAGGLGSAIAEVLAKEYPVRMDFVGIEDSFGESGEPMELMQKYGLTAENIVSKVVNLLK
jgi:transketolase